MKKATLFILMLTGAITVFCQGNAADQRQQLMQAHKKGLQMGAKTNMQLQPVQAGVPLQSKSVQAGATVQKAAPITPAKRLTAGKSMSQRDWQAAHRLTANKNFQPKPASTLNNVKPAEQMAALKESNHKPLQQQGCFILHTRGRKALKIKEIVRVR